MALAVITLGLKAAFEHAEAEQSFKTLYNRFIRWSRMGVFNRIFAELAALAGVPERLMIDATHLKAHRTAASCLKRGMFPAVSVGRKAA